VAYWSYPEIEALIEDETSRTVTLSAASVGLLTCVLTSMQSRYSWRNEGQPLSDAEWDTVDAQIANAYVELMSGV